MRAWRDDPVIARASPFLVFIGFLILESAPSFVLAVQGTGLSSLWLAVARAAVIGLLLLWFRRSYTELAGPSSVRALDWALAMAGGIVVFVAWIAIDQDWAVFLRATGSVPLRSDGSIDPVQALARLAGLALVVPVMEELFWRSLVLRWIEQHDFQSLAPRDVG